MSAPSDATSIQQTLQRVFGYASFRPHQQQIIEDLIVGRDAFVLMPTGGGKSLCYQIPALHRRGVGIVVSPLISLMKDQVDALRADGVRAAMINSTLDPAAQQWLNDIYDAVRDRHEDYFEDTVTLLSMLTLCMLPIVGVAAPSGPGSGPPPDGSGGRPAPGPPPCAPPAPGPGGRR